MKTSCGWATRAGSCAVIFGLLFSENGLSQTQPPPQAPIKTSSNGSTLPSLGERYELSTRAERRIGDKIAASIYRDPDYLDDPVLGHYLQHIFQPLMAAARARGELTPEMEADFSWEIMLLRNPTLNAFALPGAYFGVHTGLISTVSNADELAAVLGHELSHATQRHIARLVQQQGEQTPWLVGALIFGALAGAKNPDVLNAAVVGGQALVVQNQLNFSRDMEREADRLGLGVMTEAGFQSRGMTGMFEKLEQASRFNDNGAFPYLRSHPLTTARIAEVQARLQASPSTPVVVTLARSKDTNQAYGMLAARARILGEPGVDVLRSLAEQARQPLGRATPVAATLASLYAGVLAASYLRDFSTAWALWARLKKSPALDVETTKIIDWLALELAERSGKSPQAWAVQDFSKIAARADLLLQGRAFLALRRGSETIDRLQTWLGTHPKDASVWQLLAAAYNQTDQPLRAIRAEAEGRAAQQDYTAALDRLNAAQDLARGRRAQGLSANDYIESSIVDARKRQIEALMKEQAAQDLPDR